ncbi:LpxL/LpxP family Kdo(2)-lipid IV(A) lauroyl/palmitoleoyl acyltransferase [Porticoccus sp.]
MNHNQPFQWQFLHPRYWLTWLGIACWWLLVQLPYPVITWLGARLGAIMYRLGGYRRTVAAVNLELCFPDMSQQQREKLLRDNFTNYGIAFFEIGMAWWWPTKRLNKLVQLEGLENLDQLQGQGALLMAIHYTTLEVGASALSARYSIDGMYRPHKNPVYDYVQSRGRRTRDPEGRVYPREDVRGVFKALRQGRVIWYAPDQDYGRKQSVFANFFGVPAASVTATARFAKTGNAAVLPFSQVRLPGNQGYRVKIYPPLENFPVGDDVADAEIVNRKIEEFISAQPDQYMWIHRRFKTRPPGELRPYPKSK